MIKDISNANENVTANSYEIQKLKQALPQCFTSDGSFNMEAFKSILDGNVNITNEGYELKFLGKSYARLLASLDTETIIVPNEEHNNKPENINSENIYITGDNLDALKHLLKSYEGKIKCIYIDPPYNTGSDGFVYNDKFAFTKDELVRKLSIDEEQAERILEMTNRGSASHSAWLTFMFPRLLLARDLLSKDGVIFISIDDNEQANLKNLCDNIFGEQEFIASFIWKKRQMVDSRTQNGASRDHDYLLCYGKTDVAKIVGKDSDKTKYKNPDNDPRGLWMSADMTGLATEEQRPNLHYTLKNPVTGIEYSCPKTGWRYSKERMQELISNNEVIFPSESTGRPRRKKFLKDINSEYTGLSTILDTVYSTQGTREVRTLFDEKEVFDFPKPVEYIKLVLTQIAYDNATILDFFSGSATTAHAVMEHNAYSPYNIKYIMVQLPEKTSIKSAAYTAGYETIDQIGRERIIRAAAKIREENPDTKVDLGFKHYVLQDIPEKKLIELEDFDPDAIFAEEKLLEYFTKPTVLTTWLVKDGYGFNTKVEEIKLADYTAYYCDNHLYLLDTDFDDEAMKALYEKYDAEVSFKPENIVLFGYSFTYTQTALLKDNLKKLKAVEDNKNVNVIVRY